MESDQLIKQIADLLIAKKLLPVEQWEKLRSRLKAGKTLEEVLVGDNVITPSGLNQIKSEIFGVPTADLAELVVPSDVLNVLTQKVSQNYQMVVFERKDDTISVGMVNPGDFQAHEAIEFLAKQQGLATKYFVISLSDFRVVSNQYSGFKKEVGAAMEAAEEKFTKQQREELSSEPIGDIEEVIKTAPVAKIVSVIVRHAVDGGASDIHIEPGVNEARVRYRVDGVLHTSLTLPNHLHSSVVSRIKVLANMKLDETRLPQDGRIRFELDGQDIDLRVAVLPMLNAEKVVMRILNSSAGVPTLQALGYSPYHIEIIERNSKKPYGLFLLTGPTGSGKTTTLYSILNTLNGDGVNITTLEDPIEYYIGGINQSQINPEIGFSFAQGLRSILRQDPNIIMVGEIRDNETVELVVHAALTGHLVFSTLHTNNAWGSIPRMMDMEAEPFLLSSTINLVMAQRLVRKVCPDCREEQVLPPATAERVAAELTKIPPALISQYREQRFYHGKGCSTCGQTGYVGRMVIGEVLEIGAELRNLIARDFTMDQINDQLTKQGYVTIMQDGIIKALAGLTTVEEILRVSQENALV